MGFWKSVKRIGRKIVKVAKRNLKVAIPVALAYATGGLSAAVMAGGYALSSGIKPKTSAVTGVTALTEATATDATDTAAQVVEKEKKKRLALNAAVAAGNTTSPLGVTTGATVTKRNLLGL